MPVAQQSAAHASAASAADGADLLRGGRTAAAIAADCAEPSSSRASGTGKGRDEHVPKEIVLANPFRNTTPYSSTNLHQESRSLPLRPSQHLATVLAPSRCGSLSITSHSSSHPRFCSILPRCTATSSSNDDSSRCVSPCLSRSHGSLAASRHGSLAASRRGVYLPNSINFSTLSRCCHCNSAASYAAAHQLRHWQGTLPRARAR